MSAPSLLGWGKRWALGGDARGAAPARRSTAPGADPAEVETVTILMKEPLDGRVGVAIQSGRRTVSSLAHKDASSFGWRVGDVIVEINGEEVLNNDAVKAAVGKALVTHKSDGQPMRFVVKRRMVAVDRTRSMLRMTPGTGGALTMSMVDLSKSLLGEFPVVLFMEGTLKEPHSNLGASAVQALMETDLAFKAVDCVDEKYNPGIRPAVEELAGEYMLPQLFAGGKRIANGYQIQELKKSGKLQAMLRDAGAADAVR
eukprot:CAMPEP_0115090166 /NCGR_PEP_ID=MMETSP0227-20121206/25232_1 /TAXON_ID=89957 /ORGANISM="Polarella glacialis, Strain CCMP 1383" /LENGTH=256 /DNA_ID=CAMNT_0002481189 /DNA_START=132 /DNA_END=902 /DNA_ORIENTATION=-